MRDEGDDGTERPVLLTGATGFIGRRLLPRLLEGGVRVRAVSRRPRHQTGLPEHPDLEFVRGDVLEQEDLARMLEGCRAAYYLVHSMEGGVGGEEEFVERDRRAALNFSEAASEAELEHIIYVSGLEPDEEVSKHLRSRNDVEEYLRRDGVPVTVIRAGFIIGPGSAGFQMLRGLVGQMDSMMMPEYMHCETQPAFIDDIVEALALCLEHPERSKGETFEVGSEEVVEYFDIIRDFCACAGRQVEFLEVPWAPVKLAATYISAVSGLSYALVVALAEGLKIDLYVTDERLYERFPSLERTSPAEAMRRAWRQFEQEERAQESA